MVKEYIPCSPICCGCADCLNGSTPTTVQLIIGQVADGSCGNCNEEFNTTFTLNKVEACAYELSFVDAGITCYATSGVAGFYAEIIDGGGGAIEWDVAILSSAGTYIAHWSLNADLTSGPDYCMRDFVGSASSLLVLEAWDTVICDWSSVTLSLTPVQ